LLNVEAELRLARRPNGALQPTCGARLRRGGELRRRRMRLNFGVRRRHQPCRESSGPRGFQPAFRTYSRLQQPGVAVASPCNCGAADKWLNSNTALPQLLVSADWRPRIYAAQASTPALPQHLMEG
jgi:hypothetical protein